MIQIKLRQYYIDLKLKTSTAWMNSDINGEIEENFYMSFSRLKDAVIRKIKHV
jgi:hypothetical protein